MIVNGLPITPKLFALLCVLAFIVLVSAMVILTMTGHGHMLHIVAYKFRALHLAAGPAIMNPRH